MSIIYLELQCPKCNNKDIDVIYNEELNNAECKCSECGRNLKFIQTYDL